MNAMLSWLRSKNFILPFLLYVKHLFHTSQGLSACTQYTDLFQKFRWPPKVPKIFFVNTLGDCKHFGFSKMSEAL